MHSKRRYKVCTCSVIAPVQRLASPLEKQAGVKNSLPLEQL